MEEQEKQFDAVLKKSVAMYTLLTGKSMTEREGRAFIEIFDMAEAYLTKEVPVTGATEAFDILSQVLYEGPTDEELQENLRRLVENPPAFVGRDGEPGVVVQGNRIYPDPARCAIGRCTCTNDILAEVPLPANIIAVDPASPDGDYAATAEVEFDDYGNRKVKSVQIEAPKGAIRSWLDAEPAGLHRDVGLGKTATAVQTQPQEPKQRYCPEPIHCQTRNHIQGYDWQIVVLSRDKDADNSYVVHFAFMPTQAQFDEHFVKFHDRTHYVHVNEWVHGNWEGITDRYDRSAPTAALTKPDAVVRTAPAPELRGRDVSQPPMSTAWEEPAKPWRIRYFSDVAQEVIFSYCDKRPTSAQMAHFHHAKCMAVSQARPKDVS